MQSEEIRSLSRVPLKLLGKDTRAQAATSKNLSGLAFERTSSFTLRRNLYTVIRAAIHELLDEPIVFHLLGQNVEIGKSIAPLGHGQ